MFFRGLLYVFAGEQPSLILLTPIIPQPTKCVKDSIDTKNKHPREGTKGFLSNYERKKSAFACSCQSEGSRSRLRARSGSGRQRRQEKSIHPRPGISIYLRKKYIFAKKQAPRGACFLLCLRATKSCVNVGKND